MLFRIATLFFYLLSVSVIHAQKVTPLKEINSEYDEQCPVLSLDGKTLYFTRSRHPENVAGAKDEGDIWVSEKDAKGNWQSPQRMDNTWNNDQKNAVAGFYNNGNSVILMNHYLSSNKFRPGISVSHFRNGEWSFPEALGVDYFFNKSSDYHISLNEAGNILIMSLESYGNVGAEDLYASFIKPNGEWSEPIHLGWDINTRFQEMTPFLAADNKTLFFSSNGHSGEGSKDIFISTRLDDTWKKWSTPLNMGTEINSKGLETSYFQALDEEYAYFVSTQNSEGYGDIFQVKLKDDQHIAKGDSVAMPMVALETEKEADNAVSIIEEVPVNQALWLKALVVDSITQAPIEAIALVSNGQGLTLEIQADSTGFLTVELSSIFNYQLKIHAPGYFQKDLKWTNSASTATILLKPIEVGATIRLKHLLFEQGKSTILESSHEELNRLVELMRENPEMEIALEGHTDNQGSFKVNMRLSQERVDKVKEYLVDKGIKSSRVSGKGYGSTQPIANNQNPETRKLNRRVEMKIVKN